MKMVITREKLFATLILLPYIEGNFIQDIFDLYLSNSAAIKAIIVFMIALIFIFTPIVLLTGLKRKFLKKRYYSEVLLVFVTIAFFQSMFLAKDLLTSFCMWLWLCIPILYACIAVEFCRLLRLDITNIFHYMLRYFALYIVIALVFYIQFRGLFLDATVRFAPRGGGAVIFGYTMALAFALALHVRSSFNNFEYYLILTTLTIGVFGTLSRGAVWTVVFCWFANFAFKTINKKKVIFLLLLGVLIFSFASTNLANIFSSTTFIGKERLLNLASFRRVETILDFLAIEKDVSFFDQLFGFGLGNVFPYINWWINIHDVTSNTFFYNGYLLLVQPHNSFIYLILETGLIGFILILIVLFLSMKSLFTKKEKCFRYQMLFFCVFILANLLDSVFFVQPGAAGLFWLLGLLVVERHLQLIDGASCYD